MRPAFAVVLCLPLVLTGCSLSPTMAPSPGAGLAIRGTVHGGQQPIVGAHIYLLAAGNTGDAGPGITASTVNASASLLSSISTGQSDLVGAYVTTDSGGGFSITGDYTCTPNAQVYIYALGGNPGFGQVNPSAGLLAALGNCSSLSASTFISVNEVSTIAAAYALSGFATDATHVSSSPSALASVGIQNAFANAANLASLATGAALSTTPNGNGTVPQDEIYALANILGSCINSTGATNGPTNPTACYTLFNNAKSGGSSGTIPSDTASAAINIAHNPGANVSALFGLAAANPPFASSLALPNDFTVRIEFTGGGLNTPNAIAIDGSGNAWIANNSHFNVTELSSTGVPISPSAGFTGGGLNGVFSIAIDGSGNAWIPDNNTSKVSEFTSSGSPVAGSPYSGDNLIFPYAVAIDGSGSAWITNFGGTPSITKLSGSVILSGTTGYTAGLSRPISVAIDGFGNAWVADNNNSNVVEFSSVGGLISTPATGYTGGGLGVPYAIAIDGSGSAWIANYGSSGNGDVTKLSSSGAAISPSTGYTDGGVNHPYGIAIDGSGNVWAANNGNNTVTELSSSGVAISPSTGYIDATVGAPDSIAVDGSGNVWTANAYASNVTEMIGAATPVVTPLSAGVRNNTLGTRP